PGTDRHAGRPQLGARRTDSAGGTCSEPVPRRTRLGRPLRGDVFGEFWAGPSFRSGSRCRPAAGSDAAGDFISIGRWRPAPVMGGATSRESAAGECSLPAGSTVGKAVAKFGRRGRAFGFDDG